MMLRAQWPTQTRRKPVHTSTWQAGAIYLPTAEPGFGHRGVVVGKEMWSGQGIVFGAHEMYGPELTSPNVLVIGDVGSGKSSMTKTVHCLRPIAHGKHVAVIDSKPQQGRGEWTPVAEALGVRPIRLARRGGVRINPLDPRIARDDPEEDPNAPTGSVPGQDSLLRTIAEVALDRPLTPREGYALQCAHDQVIETLDVHAHTIQSVAEAIFDPRVADAERVQTSVARLVEDGRDVGLELLRMCRGDLAGMFDGETSPEIDLASPLILFDVSDVDPESPALAVAMCVIGTWLSQVWARQDGVQRIFVLEEGWHVLSRSSTARLLRRLWKFARGLGLSNVAVLHHVSDVPLAGTEGAEGRRSIRASDFTAARRAPSQPRRRRLDRIEGRNPEKRRDVALGLDTRPCSATDRRMAEEPRPARRNRGLLAGTRLGLRPSDTPSRSSSPVGARASG